MIVVELYLPDKIFLLAILATRHYAESSETGNKNITRYECSEEHNTDYLNYISANEAHLKGI